MKLGTLLTIDEQGVPIVEVENRRFKPASPPPRLAPPPPAPALQQSALLVHQSSIHRSLAAPGLPAPAWVLSFHNLRACISIYAGEPCRAVTLGSCAAF